ncbi:MAG: hypothetical protein JXA42_19010 [Anaerolineales bacterium]|nr:hypothetical protein [Anaerolineales bacterium]
MSERIKGAADIVAREKSGDVKVDPDNPITWFLSQVGDPTSWMGFAGATIDHQLWLSKAPVEKILTNAESNVKLAAAVSAYYGLSSAFGGIDPYNTEAEALGQKLIYGKESIPTIDYREPRIAKYSDLEKLKPPDEWLSKGRVKLHWDIFKLCTVLGATNAMYCSPFSLAVQLRSYPLLIRDIRKNPAFVHDLLSCLSDVILPSYLKEQQEYTGLSLSLGVAAWQSFPNVTTEMMEEFALPYDLRVMQACFPFGMTAVQIGGADYCEEIPSKFDKSILHKCFDIQIQMAAGQPSLFLFMGRTQDIPIEWIVEYLDRFKQQGVKATFSVEINARVMRDGPPEYIQSLVKRYVDNIGRDHNLFMTGLMPSDTPPVHMHAAVAAARAFTTFPIPENLDEIKVEIPLRESFQEYVDRMSNGKGIQY